MKPKTLILMGLAVVCGLGASYMTAQLLAKRQPDEEKVTVLVAKRNLSVGEAIRKPEDLFDPKQFVVGQEPKEAVADEGSGNSQRQNHEVVAPQGRPCHRQ